MSTARCQAEEWLRTHKPKCRSCEGGDLWFTGIELNKVYPDGYDGLESLTVQVPTARFVCSRPGCGALLLVDCAAAHIGSHSTNGTSEPLISRPL